jgi:hypothetical protein
MGRKTIVAASGCTQRVLSRAEMTAFRYQGFLQIAKFAPPDAIAEVRAVIDGLYSHAGRESGAQDNLLLRAPELRRSAVFQSCRAIAKQLLGKTSGYAFDQGLYKEAHGKHGAPWHQDGAFHGPFVNTTVSFWIPFQDVTTESGCMQFIPLRAQNALLPHRPFFPHDARSLMTDHVDPSHAIPCPLSVGEVTVHGPLTLHMAFANRMGRIRRTWTVTFTPWGQWSCLTPRRFLNRSRAFLSRLSLLRRPR